VAGIFSRICGNTFREEISETETGIVNQSRSQNTFDLFCPLLDRKPPAVSFTQQKQLCIFLHKNCDFVSRKLRICSILAELENVESRGGYGEGARKYQF